MFKPQKMTSNCLGVFLHRDNRVIIGMNVDVKQIVYYTSGKLKENQWYTYEIKQDKVFLFLA